MKTVYVPSPHERPRVALALEIFAWICGISSVGWLLVAIDKVTTDSPSFMTYFTAAGSSLLSAFLLGGFAKVISLLAEISDKLVNLPTETTLKAVASDVEAVSREPRGKMEAERQERRRVFREEAPFPIQAAEIAESPARTEAETKLRELGTAYAAEDLAAKQGDAGAAARRDAISVEKRKQIDRYTWDNLLTDHEAEAIFAEMAFPLGRPRA